MSKELQDRTKKFSLSIIDLVERMDYSITKKVVMNQLVRSATSVGANYRAANRARSDREFISKMNIVLEEIDECCFWLEIIQERQWMNDDLEIKEANELTAICVTILKKMNTKLSHKRPLPSYSSLLTPPFIFLPTNPSLLTSNFILLTSFF
jgi:four helix bundle protein